MDRDSEKKIKHTQSNTISMSQVVLLEAFCYVKMAVLFIQEVLKIPMM